MDFSSLPRYPFPSEPADRYGPGEIDWSVPLTKLLIGFVLCTVVAYILIVLVFFITVGCIMWHT
jgi:hypothetical protein